MLYDDGKNVGLIENRDIKTKLKKSRAELKKSRECVKRVYLKAMKASQAGFVLTGEYEWLCDNFYILERISKSASFELSKSEKQTTDGVGNAFVMTAAKKLIERSDSITEEGICAFLCGIGEKTHISEAFLCAFIPCCKAQIVIHAAGLCVKMERELKKIFSFHGEQLDTQSSKYRCKRISELIAMARAVDKLDFDKIYEKSSPVVKIYESEKAGIYPKMDKKTKKEYIKATVINAKKLKMSERDYARELVKRADMKNQHIGHELFSGKTASVWSYVIAVFITAVLFTAIAALTAMTVGGWLSAVTVLLCGVALAETAKAVVDHITVKSASATYIPRMELEKIPDDGATVTVLSVLLTSEDDVKKYTDKLEIMYCANPYNNLIFGLLADFRDGDREKEAEDEGIRIAAQKGIEQLNAKYGNRFALFLRNRRYNEKQKKYMGWERKRGAIVTLASTIADKKICFDTFLGDAGKLFDCKYILTFDSDSEIQPDGIIGMVGAMLHPLNKPVIEKGRVVKGYGILNPCIEVGVESAVKSVFSRFTSGFGGVDSYAGAVSDVYQHLFSESIFTGKGIIDVQAFSALMADKIRENTVLSHDIIEGGILRTGFISDIKVTDGYPSSPSSYYARSHRWIRGDWQNIRFLKRKIKDEKGKSVENPLSFLTKLRLFDNLRRSLTPVFTVLGIVLASFLPKPQSVVMLFLLLSWLIMPFLFAVLEGILKGGLWSTFRMYFSKSLGGIKGAGASLIIWLLLLVHSAYTSFTAICGTIWRMTVTKRGLLSWVTAEQSEKISKNSLISYAMKMASSVIAGAIMLFADCAVYKLIGVLWLTAPVTAFLLSKPITRKTAKLTEAEKATLKDYAEDIWRFFEENLTEENMYLPPDNIQEKPVERVAKRTSPTNIGLAILSIISACDFGFISREKQRLMLTKMADSIEALEKYRGHLYNWYDLTDGKAIEPEYVSSVDSGNFAACCITASNALAEIDEKLSKRYSAMWENADWALLYSEKSELFHIGFNTKTCKAEGLYDLFMSEAKITSYLAIAKRRVPQSHWAALGRPLVKKGCRIGIASWSGTSFEYFMPQLFMPVYHGSAGYEAAKFAAYCQQKKCKKTPFGISESGYYAFDRLYNYQYKAFGVESLALKNELYDDLVISPYSSFLMLCVSPVKALKNLQHMKELGFYGKYGFYEAIDYTASRVGTSVGIVRSFMSHHLGMSMLALANRCFDNIVQKRFLATADMKAMTPLLKEKIPTPSVIHEKKPRKARNIKNARDIYQLRQKSLNDASKLWASVISNGETTFTAKSNGEGCLIFGDLLLTDESGINVGYKSSDESFFAAKTPMCGESMEQKLCRECGFDKGKIAFSAFSEKTHLEQSMTISAEQNAMLINIKAKKCVKNGENGTVCFTMRPVMAKKQDFSAHKAFSDLFIESFFDDESDCVLFARRKRALSDTEHWLAVKLPTGVKVKYCTQRDKAMMRKNAERGAQIMDESNKQGACVTPIMHIEMEWDFDKGAFDKTIAVSYGKTRQSAVRAAEKASAVTFAETEKKLCTEIGTVMNSFGIGERDMSTISRVLFEIMQESYDIGEKKASMKRSSLWKYGISGDIPVLTLRVRQSEQVLKIGRILRAHRLLNYCSVASDLVIIYDETEQYLAPIADGIKRMIQIYSTAELMGQSGGIHLIAASKLQENEESFFESVAHYFWDGEDKALNISEEIQLKKPIYDFSPSVEYKNGGVFINGAPRLPWSNVLANRMFGSVLSDKSLGFTWMLSSRENKITPWSNDIVRDNEGETLIYEENGVSYDVLAYAKNVFFDKNTCIYECEIKTEDDVYAIKVKAFIHENLPLKLIEAELCDRCKGSVTFKVLPMLCADEKDARLVNGESSGELCLFTNKSGEFPKQTGFIWCKDGKSGVKGKYCEVKSEKKRTLFVLGCAKNGKTLEYLKEKLQRLDFAKELERVKKKNEFLSRHIETSDESLDRLYTDWLGTQIVQCRMRARTSFYQCGGAYGFRDQLQDAMAAYSYDKKMLKQQILRCCRHQYVQGDVMHWWHELDGVSRGIRTRYGDDMLWLALAVAQYVEKSGDEGLLKTQVHFVTSELLKDEERERYEIPQKSEEKASVYEHCIRAIKHADRCGERGLILFGGGDWNDGMNLVGARGKGESVWLSEFMIVVMGKFLPIVEKMGDTDFADYCKNRIKELKNAVESHCYLDGRYIRGFYDDGTAMGSDGQCRVDAIAQAFAVFAELDEKRCINAMNTAYDELVDEKEKLIKLLTPPFDKGGKQPGYIKGYPSGIRENGGQYTHGAVWLALAFLKTGDKERCFKLLKMLNPMEKDTVRYMTEPYVMAADIYTNGAQYGRGGWSWYTGAAGWMAQTLEAYAKEKKEEIL